MNLAPIILFVYNRPAHIKHTIEALLKNILASESHLYIFSDGPKNNNDKLLVDEVREYLKTIKGFRDIHIIERSENIGLANSIISGVTEIIEKYEKAIILEDDLVTSPYFLKYMNEALNYYEFSEEVICISGFIYPIKETLPNTFFIKGADNLGWATWKRGWKEFESNGEKLSEYIKQNNLRREFTRNYSYPYYKMLKDQIKGKNNSWAIRWYASAFIKNKLVLYPHKSLVIHIGSDGSGSNVKVISDVLGTSTYNCNIVIDPIEINENKTALKYMEKYLKRMMLTLLYRYFFSLLESIYHKIVKPKSSV